MTSTLKPNTRKPLLHKPFSCSDGANARHVHPTGGPRAGVGRAVGLTGMGFRLGAELRATVGDPVLINSPDQLAAWAGLAPVPKDSGKRTRRLHTPQR
jgi:transposase